MILKSKLTIPTVRPVMVDRPRLIKRLREESYRRLILITGPTGSGKTSLACQWIREDKILTVWCAFDENNNTPDLFVRYIMTGLQEAEKAFEPIFRPFLIGHTPPNSFEVMATIVRAMEGYTRNFHLVLDDYHAIRCPEIHDAVRYLILNAPPPLHIVLLSRHAPPFPIMKFRARDQVTEIKPSELLFTHEEASDFFSKVMTLDFTPEEFRYIFEKTEGWVTGLQFAGMASLRKGRAIRSVAAGFEKDAVAYLMEEVFTCQPEPVQTFLLKTAILDRFNLNLCRQVTGMDMAGDILDLLEQKHLFLVPLDEDGQWFRYHHLFGALLKALLAKNREMDAADFHKKAALWYAENRQLESAFHHAFATENMDFAADMLEDHLLSVLIEHDSTTFFRWLDRLPSKFIHRRPILILFSGLAAVGQGHIRKAEAALEDYERKTPEGFQTYSEEKKQFARDLLPVVTHLVSLQKDPINQDIDGLYRSLQSVSPGNSIVRAALEGYIAWAYMERGDVLAALDPIRNVLKEGLLSRSSYTLSLMHRYESFIEGIQGRLSQAETILKNGLKVVEEEGLPVQPFKQNYHYCISRIYYLRNEIPDALEHISLALKFMEAKALMGYQTDGYRRKAFIHLAAGQKDAALEMMEKAKYFAEQTHSQSTITIVQGDTARLSLLMGDLSYPIEWSEARKLRMDEPFSVKFEFDCLVQAHQCLLQKRYDAARLLLEHLKPRCAKRGRFEFLLRIDIFLAAAVYGLDDHQQAVETLESAVAFAGPEKYCMPFLENVPFMANMLIPLRKMADVRVRTHAQVLLKALKTWGHQPKSLEPLAVGDAETLTSREAEILNLVVAGFNNREIAEQNYIAVTTVKTHIRSIFGKLGVSNREEAISKALALELV